MQQQQLAQVELRDQHPAIAATGPPGVRRERIEVAKVGVGDGLAVGLEPLDRAADRAVGGAPAEDQQVAPLGPVDLEIGDVVGDPGDLGRPERLHPVVVVGVVADVAGDVRLLQAADAVLEAGRPGHGPRPGQGDWIAVVRMEAGPLGPVRRPRCRAGRRHRAGATARRRWPGRRRTGRPPGSCT